jgi:peptidoglycan/LPS O-acetylase OafA/YrhL
VSLVLDTRIPLGRPGMIYAAVLGYQTYRYHQDEISARAWHLNIVIFLLLTLASNFVAFGYFHHPKITLMQAVGPWTAALILFVSTIRFPAFRGVLANPAVVGIGAASYSIYMMHPLAIALAVHLGAAILVIPAALVLTLAMAMLGYRLIELPGIRLGRTLADRRPLGQRPAAALS